MRDWGSEGSVGSETADNPIYILADWKPTMASKEKNPNFEETLEVLRVHGFDVAPCEEVASGVRVSKYGAGAILKAGAEGAAEFAESPGALVGGAVARLLDRGYQKFIKTSKFEIPATATQLQAIHQFSEELRQITGSISLYNESLGTTSDQYQYDRLKGREPMHASGGRPWDGTEGH